jgi:4'-phosphopantetheinyl transferase
MAAAGCVYAPGVGGIGRMPGVVTVASTSVEDVGLSELADLARRLPPVERERAARLRVDAQRARFVVGRLLARAVVGRFAGLAPAAVELDVEEAGRPVVLGASNPTFLSIAHSGRCVVVAVAARPVGVDIERLPDLPLHPRLAARLCSPTELERLEALSGADRERGILAVWARKEAYGKALGVGLDFPWRSVTAGPAGSRLSGVAGTWQVVDLDVGPGWVAAVVAKGAGWQVDLAAVDRAVL